MRKVVKSKSMALTDMGAGQLPLCSQGVVLFCSFRSLLEWPLLTPSNKHSMGFSIFCDLFEFYFCLKPVPMPQAPFFSGNNALFGKNRFFYYHFSVWGQCVRRRRFFFFSIKCICLVFFFINIIFCWLVHTPQALFFFWINDFSGNKHFFWSQCGRRRRFFSPW